MTRGQADRRRRRLPLPPLLYLARNKEARIDPQRVRKLFEHHQVDRRRPPILDSIHGRSGDASGCRELRLRPSLCGTEFSEANGQRSHADNVRATQHTVNVVPGKAALGGTMCVTYTP